MALPTFEPTTPTDSAPKKLPWTRPELIDLSLEMDEVRLGTGGSSDGTTFFAATFS